MAQQPKKSGLRAALATVNPPVAAVFFGFASLVTSALIFLVARELDAAGWAFFILGILLIISALALGYRSVRSAVMTRQGFYGFNTTAMVLLFLAIAAVIIFVAAQNNQRLDVTSTREFSLSQQSKKVLQDLTRDVEAVAFLVPTDLNQLAVRSRVLDTLEEYAQTTSKFSYRVVDPELEPAEARRLGVNADLEPASVVFLSEEGNRQPVRTLIFSQQGGFLPNPRLEQDFTQALLAVTRTQQKAVYFLTRHGERDPTSTEGTGFSRAREGLLGNNYEVKTLDLAGAGAIPADLAVLVIAGPDRDLLPEEAPLLDEFLRKGGKALFLLDPDPPKSFRDLLATWGVTIGNGTIVDLASSVQSNPRAPLVRRERYVYGPAGLISPIIQPITDVSFFERATSIAPTDGRPARELDRDNVYYNSDNLKIIPLALTIPLVSWRETDPDKNEFNAAAGDVRGPFAIGVEIDARAPFGQEPPATGEAPRTQIVVWGDSDFATNRFIDSFANQDLFLNSVNDLAGDVSLISVRSKLSAPRLLIVTSATWNFIRWSSLLILPIAVAMVGVFVWWRRR